MSEPTDNRLPDEALDDYLKGDSSVSRQYRQLHGAEVPAELDRLVLRQAEDAVKARSAKQRTWMRWSAPLALAASAVLVVSIVIQPGVQEKASVTSAEAPAMAPAPVMEAKRMQRPMNDAAGNSAAEESDAAPEPEDTPTQTTTQERSVTRERRAAPPPVILIEPAVPPPDVDIYFPPSSAPAPAPAPQRAVQMRPTTPPPAADTSVPVAENARNEAVAKAVLEEQVATAARAQDASEAELARAEQVAAIQRSMREAQSQLAGAASAHGTVMPIGTPKESAYSSPISAERLLRDYTDPEAWLKDIRQLRKENKQAEADFEWRRFVAKFPEHPVAETDVAREVKR